MLQTALRPFRRKCFYGLFMTTQKRRHTHFARTLDSGPYDFYNFDTHTVEKFKLTVFFLNIESLRQRFKGQISRIDALGNNCSLPQSITMLS